MIDIHVLSTKRYVYKKSECTVCLRMWCVTTVTKFHILSFRYYDFSDSLSQFICSSSQISNSSQTMTIKVSDIKNRDLQQKEIIKWIKKRHENFKYAKWVQKPESEERPTMQWSKEKGQNRIYKILHRKLKIESHESHNKAGALVYLNISAERNGFKRTTTQTPSPPTPLSFFLLCSNLFYIY